MKFLRNHWYDLCPLSFFIALIFLVVNWSDSSFLEKLALINFMAVLLHQFEEYRFPGGAPAIRNVATESNPDKNSDRYPLNQNNAMLANVFFAYVIYLLPVFMPDRLWISFTPVVFGSLVQFVTHGIVIPRKIGNKFYSPGLVAVLFGHVPVAILWFYYTITQQKLTWLDVLFGFVYLVAISIFMQKVGYGLLVDENSKYPFPEEEMNRGGYIEKIKNLQHT